MVMFLQIVLLLLLISLVAILIGYLIGKLYCKNNEDSTIIKKGVICEDNYYKRLIEINQEEDSNITKDDFIPNDSVSVEDSQSNNNEQSIQAQKLVSNNSTNITHIDSSKIKEQENQKESQADTQADTSKEETIKPSTQDNNLEDETINKTNLENSKQNISNNENEASTTKEDKKDNINQDKPKEISKDQEKTKSNDSSSNTKNEHDINEDKTSKDIKNEDNINEDNINEDSIKEDSIKPSLLLDKPKDGKADNLTKIKGVGKVIEEKLNNLGIYHFEQIASLTNEEINWVDEHLAFKGRILRENWIEQAKILAKGEETEFSKRVEKGEVETSKKSS